MNKEIMFKISSELNDGVNFGVCKTVKQLLDAVQAWADEAQQDHPQDCAIETIEMTDEEYNKIPEI